MANRYKVPNLNVNYFLCGQGCARNEAADGNAGGRREGAEVCDTFWGVEYGIMACVKTFGKVSFSKVFLNGCYLDGCGLKFFLILTAHLRGLIRYT